MANRLSLIGRERVMIDQLTKEIYNRITGEMTQIYKNRRGNTFEVLLEDGRVAKVTVELDRVEQ